MGVYKITRPDGSVEYSDQPGGAGKIEPMSSDGSRPYDHKQVKDVIKEVQKRVPKLNDYLEYLDYLRNHRPYQLDRVLSELQKEDPQTWLKLQKYPQFRPLRETALGFKAAEKNIGTGIGIVTGNFTGSAEKWLETTVKDMMKRDRYGPYAQVLGSKASTLPAPKPPTYSNSRLGQYLKTEEPRAMEAAKQAAKDGESAKAALRNAKATAVTRALNPLLDLGIAALDPDVHRGTTNFVVEVKLKKALASGALDEEQYTTAHNLMAEGKFAEMQAYLSSLGEK